jgi:hypothetical protein
MINLTAKENASNAEEKYEAPKKVEGSDKHELRPPIG